jgi:hypothetical protein
MRRSSSLRKNFLARLSRCRAVSSVISNASAICLTDYSPR